MAQRNGLISAVVCALLAVIVSAPAAGAAAGSAFVRVNQLGYPLGAPKRAFLMSSADRPGPVFHVVDASGRTVLSGQVGASTGSWSDAYPSVRTIDFSALRRAGTFTDHGRRPGRRHLAAVSDRQRLDGLLDGDRERAPLLRGAARRSRLRALGAAHCARAPERRARDDVPDAQGRWRRDLRGRPDTAGQAHRRVGRLVGRRRLPQVPARDQLHRDDPGGRRPRLPRADGRRRGSRELHGRGALRGRMAAADVGRPHAHPLLSSGHRLGE